MNPRTFDILELYDSGHSVGNIAERVGILERSVTRTLQRHNRLETDPRAASVPVCEFMRVWNLSDNAHQVMRHFELSFNSVTSKAHRLRLKGYSLKYMRGGWR